MVLGDFLSWLARGRCGSGEIFLGDKRLDGCLEEMACLATLLFSYSADVIYAEC